MKRTRKSILNIGLAVLLFLGLASLPTQPAQAAEIILYVAPSGQDSANCATPSTPCATIRAAILKAPLSNLSLIIRVAIGVYTGNAETGNYVAWRASPTSYSGGWNNSFTKQIGFSTIDGQQQIAGLYLYFETEYSIDRFIIHNGKGNVYASSGGIVNMGRLTLTNSIIAHNVGSSGGGITSYGKLIMKNTVIRDNFASIQGGGIFVNSVDHNYISNSTIYNNSAPLGGGIYSINMGGYSLYLNNLTITDNTATTGGGGINAEINSNYGSPKVYINNTILARNGGQAASPDCSGIIISEGYNLIKDSTGCTVNGDVTGNITGADPLLLPVIESTGYYPLRSTSPAINAGDPTGCFDAQNNLLTTDQRGAPRMDRCDIGAYEYTVPGPTTNLLIISGNNQSAGLLNPFPAPLQVRALDVIGSPVSGESISLSAPDSGPSGTFEDNDQRNITVITDEGGLTPALLFRANDHTGSYMATASNQSSSLEVDFHLTNLGRVYLPLVSKPDPAQIVDTFPFANKCGYSMVTYNGKNEAKVTLCVTSVRICLDGQMYFDMRWSVEFLDPNVSSLYKYSDADNYNMYVTDNFGNRYDHVATGGAAAELTYFYPSGPLSADGWFMFAAASPGATVFKFHDDDHSPHIIIGNLALIH